MSKKPRKGLWRKMLKILEMSYLPIYLCSAFFCFWAGVKLIILSDTGISFGVILFVAFCWLLGYYLIYLDWCTVQWEFRKYNFLPNMF